MSVKVRCEEVDVIEIPMGEYNELVRASERIAAFERLIASNAYITTQDIMAVLDVKQKKETEER